MEKINKNHAAVCGLFCPSCTIYIATQDDPVRLQRLSEIRKESIAELQCDGCRSERRTKYCKTCTMTACAADKGIDFCVQCNEYPCEEIKKFQSRLPHRIELWQSQARIREVGYEHWLQEMKSHYSCPNCNTINSAYDQVCRKCGSTPSCNYVAQHQDEIRERMPKR